MKKLVALLLLVSSLSYGQIMIDQVILEPGPYKVGDVITMQYTVNNSGLDLNYLWFRFDYSNQHLQLVPNSTTFTQGANTQSYFTEWVGYIFNPNPQIGVGELLKQYNSYGWNYQLNPAWNVNQISIQRTDAPISGVVATQKFIVKDNTSFQNIHKLHLATGSLRNGSALTNIGSTVLWLSLNNVSRLVSSVKFKVAFPAGYDITKHKIQVMETDGNGVVNWTSNPQPAVIGSLDSSGEFLTDKLQKAKQYYVMVTPTIGMNNSNVITVTDAYKAFLALNEIGLNGTETILKTNLEKSVANITRDTQFDSKDAYYLFAYVMGIDLSTDTNAMLPTSTTPKLISNFTTNYKDFQAPPVFNPTGDNEQYNLSFAWGGDLDFSHSSPIPTSTTAKSTLATTVSVSQADSSISTAIVNGKLIVTASLSSNNLAGAEYKIGYDDSKLTLEDVIFDTGNTITNFSTHKDAVVTFGSIDKTGTQVIKPGTPYKLVFKSSPNLINTSGLIYVHFAEAVDSKGNKVTLNIQ